MKRTQRKDAIRNIRKNLISFLSVILVVTMGLTGMFSLKYMSKGIAGKAKEYYEERSFKNFEMVSSAGVTDEDIEKVRSVNGVKNAEGVIISSDASLESTKLQTQITLLTLTENVSVPEVTQGRLPNAENECMIGEDFAGDSGLEIGDTVRLHLGNVLGDYTDLIGDQLAGHEFVITGLMHHPDYVRRREIKTVVIPGSAIKETKLGNIYNRIFVKCEDDDEDEVCDRLEKLTDELENDGKDRIDELLSKYSLFVTKDINLNCNWLVLRRNANAGFVDVNSNVNAFSNVANIFGGLFMLITAVVCFSTLVIIIDGQKRQVGTVKAFGFYKSEILKKYLSYGLLSVVIGDAAGILLSLCLSGMLQQRFTRSGMYQFGTAESSITPVSTVTACVLMLLIITAASILACGEVLKTPASLLMKGVKEEKIKKRKKDKTPRRVGSLYTRLIFRNMRKDKARVLVSIGVIMVSCLLVGMGFTFKFAFDGMSKKEIEDIYLYDIRMDLNGSKETDSLEKLLKDNGCDYLPATYEMHLTYLNGQVNGVNVLCADTEKLADYFAIRTVGGGKELKLPDDGILVQNKLEERFGVNKGGTLKLLDNGLNEHEVIVKDIFQNYVGRLSVVSLQMYEKIFGNETKTNCYYIKLNNADRDEVEKALSRIDPVVTFEAEDDFITKYVSISKMYNLMIFLCVGIAVLMSFLILMNLADIFLERKKKELAIMRINGFSAGKTIGYLAREAFMTTVLGTGLGVVCGAVFAPVIIRKIEQPDLNFDRAFKPAAWIAAVLIELIFAFIVYSLVFRKVKKLSFRDIE